MTRTSQLAFAVLLLAVIVGCAGCGRVGGGKADALAAWLDAQAYSSFETFRHANGEPERPPSPDGLTLGSPNVFAAVGTNPDDLTSLDVFWGDGRTVRPLARPLVVSAQIRGTGIPRAGTEKPTPLAAFPSQTLRRVSHTSIAVSESTRDDISIRAVDFAPMAPEQNFLCRWFVVENTGSGARRVDLMLEFLVPGEWTEIDAKAHRSGDGLAFVSDTAIRTSPEGIGVSLGRLKPGQRASTAILLIAAEPARLAEHVAQAKEALPQLPELLEQTKTDWESWCAEVPLKSGDSRMDDLLDSLLCLVRAHIGPESIRTGSLRYPHNRAWIRDSYWVQRALLELGREDEGKLNLDFFHRAWQASGIASYYEVPSYGSTAYGYHGVELPHYLVLMVRDAERMAGVDGGGYWDMVRGCLDEAAVPPNGLQPMNGDETWLLAAPVRELDAQLNSSWLLAASAEYGADLAARMGDAERSARYQEMASRARVAINSFVPRLNEAEWLASGYGYDGSRDSSLCPDTLARGAVLGVMPATEPHLAAGLLTSWYRLGYERGIRTHSRSATISGGTPGYVLYAAADCPGCAFVPALARRMLDFASATGCVWEFHDMHDPTWGGEKRRLWDSAVVLMGLVHALFEARDTEGRHTFVPKVLSGAVTDAPAPSFHGEELLDRSGPALILHADSPEHAARVARELTRHRGEAFAVAGYAGRPPADDSAIIVSRAQPPAGWRSVPRGYWVRDWAGPPQIWVRNKGHVFVDTDPLVTDLLLYLTPQRAEPLPFPDANNALAARLGELSGGEAELSAVALSRRSSGRLDLTGGRERLKAGRGEVTVTAEPDRARKALKLVVGAGGPRPGPVELSVTLPAGWWLLNARDMSGRWDRVRDPVGEVRLPDGRTRLDYSFSAGEEPIYLTFELTRLKVTGA